MKWMKLQATVLASHMCADLDPGYSASVPTSCKCGWESSRRQLKCLGTCTHVEDPVKVIGFARPSLAVVAIKGMKQ